MVLDLIRVLYSALFLYHHTDVEEANLPQRGY